MKKVIFFSDIKYEDINCDFYKTIISSFTKIINELIINGYDEFYTNGSNYFDKIIFYIIQKAKKQYNISNIIIGKQDNNINDSWYIKMYKLADRIFEHINNFDGLTIQCYNNYIENKNQNIINVFWRNEKDMKINKVNNIEFFNGVLTEHLQNALIKKDKVKFLELLSEMKNKFEEQDKLFVEFDDSVLDKYLKDKKILSITDTEISFEDNDKIILIKNK